VFAYALARGQAAPVAIRFVDDAGAAPAPFGPLAADLEWLGIASTGDPVRTSARSALYHEYARQLAGTGRTRTVDGTLELLAPSGQTVIADAVKGRIVFENHALGPVALVHASGAVEAAFAAAVDAALLRPPIVLREDRQLERTARELLVLDALALPPPRYAHIGSLLPDADGGVIPAIADLRRAGFLPDVVVAHLALLGWSPENGAESWDWTALSAAFSLERVGHAPAHFNAARLRALNARALRALPPERLTALLATAMQRTNLLEDPIPAAARRWIDTFLAAYGTDFTTLGEALALVADLRAEAVVVPALELEKLRNRQVVFFLDAVGQYVDAQPELRDLPLEHDLPMIAQEFGIAHDDAFVAVRLALTGKRAGAPLTLLFPLLGHDRILIRIGAISSHLLHGRGLEPIKYGPGGVPFKTIQPTARPSAPNEP
jgi:glutamyl/glutaminyl-tRNA synthetase